MIIELICAPFFLVMQGIISYIPILTYIPTSIVDTLSLLIKAMQFFPIDVWSMVIGNIIFWITVHLIIGLIKFILGFIPTMRRLVIC